MRSKVAKLINKHARYLGMSSSKTLKRYWRETPKNVRKITDILDGIDLALKRKN